MTCVTTFNCNTIDNIYVKKHVSLWDPRMGTGSLAHLSKWRTRTHTICYDAASPH